MPSKAKASGVIPVPVFHPDHPHNRQPYPLYENPSTINTLPLPSAANGKGHSYSQSYSYAQTPYQKGKTNPVLSLSSSATSGTGTGTGTGIGLGMMMSSSSSSRGNSAGGAGPGASLSDSESSLSPSPSAKDRSSCFCGRPTLDGGIYCSVSCARSDAFSSLCYKPTAQPSFEAGPSSYPYPSSSSQQSSLAGAISSASLSRNPSSASASSITSASSGQDVGEWNASHYRRLAQADIRREERREERRRRRAEGSLASSISTSRSTVMSTSSSASRAVPDLVGGGGASHSRNPSIASSITSMSSSTWGAGSSLSRNASSASTASRRGYGNNFNLENVIHEDDDEEEWLQSEISRPYIPAAPLQMPVPTISAKKPHHKRGDSRSNANSNASNPSSTRKAGRKPTPDPLPFGMGKDMRDVLEEIIQMEKSFLVSDNDNDNDENDEDDSMAPPPAGLFTSQFDRPPRTPSPVSSGKRRASIAPGAPTRGHRSALSHSAVQHTAPAHFQPPSIVTAPQRPPSLMGLHQSSLSESHTALYLATASPVSQGRRSASPQLETRKSISFNADTAGPSLSLDAGFGGLSAPRRIFDSPSGNITPMSRRRLNHTPQAVHPSMDGWRFPSPMHGSNSTMATPTRPSAAQVPSHPHADLDDEVGSASSDSESISGGAAAAIEPALLWPAPPNLQPSLFPSSPAVETPDFHQHPRRVLGAGAGALKRSESGNTIVGEGGSGVEPVSAPGSGLRLGVLLGSGTDEEDQEHGEMDVDMDMDEDEDSSTEHGHSHALPHPHGHGQGHGGFGYAQTHGHGHGLGYSHGHGHVRNGRTGYLPVFLEAEGFRSGDGPRW
ncbi:hypothetical protein IAT40_003534 [Kwoniella sp. CBS 6097]